MLDCPYLTLKLLTMSEHRLLTVVQLRDELAKRGLSKAGLKAALIQRLEEDDQHCMEVDKDDDDELGMDSEESSPNGRASISRSDSTIPEELAPTFIRNELHRCLSSVKYVGSATASQTHQKNVDPGLHIDDVGNISLPLTERDAEAIMKIGSQAPFGTGSATIVDTSFRNTKELNPNQFQLRNPAWSEYLEEIITQLCVRLGFPNSPSGIRGELCKMLLYDTGAMFKAHED